MLVLSVMTSPPMTEAQASSKAPVTETPASMAHRQPSRIESSRGMSSPSALRVALMVALAAALLLFNPLDMGISERVTTWAPRPSSP